MLSSRDQAVLAHVVLDPEAWATHATAEVGPEAVQQKVKRWERDYDAAVAAEGALYKTRAQREA